MKKIWTQPILSLISIDKTATGSQPGWIESCLASFENEEGENGMKFDGTGINPNAFYVCRTENNRLRPEEADASQLSITPLASDVGSAVAS